MLTKLDIIDVLKKSGIQDGDKLLVHSSLRRVGAIDGGGDTLIDAFLETVGDNGLLMMPTFNYTTGIPEPYFDPKSTPGKTGMLTELLRNRSGAVRSLSPTHSVTALGNLAKKITDNHLEYESLGTGSPIDRIAKLGGYVILIGVTNTSNSTIHIGEAYAGVRKFFYRPGNLPTAKILTESGMIVEKQVDCSGSCGRAFNAVELELRRKKAVKDSDIGGAPTYIVKGEDIIKTVVEMIEKQPDILFCNRSTCRRCILGREFALLGHTVTEI